MMIFIQYGLCLCSWVYAFSKYKSKLVQKINTLLFLGEFYQLCFLNSVVKVIEGFILMYAVVLVYICYDRYLIMSHGELYFCFLSKKQKAFMILPPFLLLASVLPVRFVSKKTNSVLIFIIATFFIIIIYLSYCWLVKVLKMKSSDITLSEDTRQQIIIQNKKVVQLIGWMTFLLTIFIIVPYMNRLFTFIDSVKNNGL